MRLAARVVVVVAILIGALFAVAGSSSATPSCTNTWTGAAGDNRWDTATNWSGGVPNGASVACITLSGTYTVNADGGDETAASLELGGTSGTQTLHVFGAPNAHHGFLTLTNQDSGLGVEAGGVITLGQPHQTGATQDGTHGNVVVSGGTLTNRGTIDSGVTLNGPNSISGNLDNQKTLTIAEDTNSNFASTWTTSGNITIASSKSLVLSWGFTASFTQTAGAITNSGTFDQVGGAFIANGTGTTTGNPLQFDGGVTISPSGTGSGSFEARSGNDILGSDVASGYTLRVAGRPNAHHGLLTLNASRTNNGTILLGSTDGTHGVISVASGTLTNAGTLTSSSTAAKGPNSIDGNLIDTPTGTFTINDDLTSSGTSHWTVTGTMTIASGKSVNLSWNGSSSFTHGSGTFTNSGAFDQSGGSFVASGTGTQTGNPLQFDGGVTISPSGTGSGSFEMRSGNDVLGSDVASGYTVRVAGRPNAHHGLLTLNASRTNHGTINLGSTDGTQGTISVASGVLTNQGTIASTSTGPNGPNTLNGGFDNQGTLNVNEDFQSTVPSTWTTSGTVNIGSGKNVNLSWDSSSSLTQTGGTITNSGSFDQVRGAFTANGTGAETGNPLQFDGGVTISPSGTGSGSFEMRSGGDVLGSNVGSGYTVSVAGRPGGHHGLLTLSASHKNNGTIVLGLQDSTHGVISVPGGSVLTNAGTIHAEPTGVGGTSNGPDSISGAVTNTGTILLDENVDGGADITSSGAVTISNNQSLSVHSFIQSGGTTNLSGSGSSLSPSPGPLALQGGTLKGTGAVGSDVSNTGGTVHPGGSPGILTVTGNYTQGAGGTLAVEISGASAGSGYSRLAVTGTASLAGTLDVTTGGGFSPATAQAFQVVTGSTRTGTFSTTTFHGGRDYDVQYNPQDVTLAARGPALTVSKVGSGSGTVTSSPAGIDCGSTCSASFADGAVVTLTPSVAPGSAFAGWSGDCSGSGTCQVTMNGNHAVTATFTTVPTPPSRTLTVTKAGTGSGTVTSSPAGVDCGATCSSSYSDGTAVTLTATAAPGSTFAGWSGDCSGTGDCHLTMGADHTATATFAAVPPKPACTLKANGSSVRARALASVAATAKKKKPPKGVLKLTAKCDQATQMRLTGNVVATFKAKKGKKPPKPRTFSIAAVTASGKANVPVTLTVKLPKAALTALKQGAKESASFQLSATDANGTGVATAQIARLKLAK